MGPDACRDPAKAGYMRNNYALRELLGRLLHGISKVECQLAEP